MVKIKGALHSDEAHGSVGDCLTFSMRKSGQQVRFQRKQKIVVPSHGQADVQSLYRVIYARWLSFSDSERKVFDDEVKSKNLTMSGWNLFLCKATADPLGEIGLAGYWSFNRKGFGTVLDLSKNGNTGTLKPSWPSDSPQYVDSKNKKMLNALEFDGNNDYVNCGNIGALAPPYTIESWAYFDQLHQGAVDYDYIFSLGNHASNHVSIARSQSGDHPDQYYSYTQGGQLFGPVLIGQQWTQFVQIWNPAPPYHELYINGVSQTVDQPTGAISVNGIFYLGEYFSGAHFMDGKIDEVRIYKRKVGVSEIQNLFNMFGKA